MNDHTPSTYEVRAAFVWVYTRNFDSYQMGRTLTSEQGRYGDEFDRWLNQVKAEAWEEGFEKADRIHSGIHMRKYGRTETVPVNNPYKEQE